MGEALKTDLKPLIRKELTREREDKWKVYPLTLFGRLLTETLPRYQLRSVGVKRGVGVNGED